MRIRPNRKKIYVRMVVNGKRTWVNVGTMRWNNYKQEAEFKLNDDVNSRLLIHGYK